MIGYWHHNVIWLNVCLSVTLFIVAKQYILQKVSEQVNRKCHARNAMAQLSTLYTDLELSNSPPLKFPVGSAVSAIAGLL